MKTSATNLIQSAQNKGAHVYTDKPNTICIRHAFSKWCIWFNINQNGAVTYSHTFSQMSRKVLKKRL